MRSPRSPVLLRNGDDPLLGFGAITERYEALAESALASYESQHRQAPMPLLVIAAAGIDAYRHAAQVPEVLSETNSHAADHCAGVGEFATFDGPAEELIGVMSALHGAAGEQWVADQFVNGTLRAPSGTTTIEFLDLIDPGSDLRFSRSDGSVIGRATIKIAATAAVIVRHFDAHPDVAIVYASSDAAADAAGHGFDVVSGEAPVIPGRRPVVVDIGRSSADFDRAIRGTLTDIGRLEGILSVAELLEHLPWLSLGMIGVRAINRLQAGDAYAGVARSAGHDVIALSSETLASHAASSVTGFDPTVALVAMFAAGLTHASMVVRRGWNDTRLSHEHVASLAEEVADRYAPVESDSVRLWWGRRIPGSEHVAVFTADLAERAKTLARHQYPSHNRKT